MPGREKYNNTLTGVIAGILLPFIAFLAFYALTSHGLKLGAYWDKVNQAGNLTHIMSISVFSNIIIFLVFNRLDMLRASRGVLGITIAWAFIVFGLKLL